MKICMHARVIIQTTTDREHNRKEQTRVELEDLEATYRTHINRSYHLEHKQNSPGKMLDDGIHKHGGERYRIRDLL